VHYPQAAQGSTLTATVAKPPKGLKRVLEQMKCLIKLKAVPTHIAKATTDCSNTKFIAHRFT
jgi:hypothetical protein